MAWTLTQAVLASILVTLAWWSDAEASEPTRNWTELSPAHSPAPRLGASIAYDETRGQAVLFGGSSMNDTWVWDGGDWQERQPANRPLGRTFGMAFFDPITGNIILYGGWGAGLVFNDTWMWDGEDWTELSPATSPPALYAGSPFNDPVTGLGMFFGGSNNQLNGTSDQTWVWTDRTGS